MAIIRCPECGKEISNKAAACPSCGVPIYSDKVTSAKKTGSVRTGAIVGTVGSTALSFILIAWYSGAFKSSDSSDKVSINLHPAELTNPDLFSALGIGLIVISFALFAFGVVFANKMTRKQAIALSVAALSTSSVLLIVVIMALNFLMVCVGWLFGWEPVLMIIGGILMTSAALRLNR